MRNPSYEMRAAGLVLTAVLSVQLGSALATTLFDEIGSGGAVFLRSLFGSVALLIAGRHQLRKVHGTERRDVVYFGIALAGMNLAFYAALDRLPLGVAVTFEFVGPLGVALLGSRRRRDLIWAVLAGLGIVLLAGGVGGGGIDALGVGLALLAGAFWAAYILMSARVGNSYPGLGGLAIAMSLSTLIAAPFGIVEGAGDLISAEILAVALGVGLLSSAIPYALELEALRRLPNAVFGVLMSMEPAVAALIGFIALSQGLALVEAVAIGLVVAASAGALRSASTPAPRDG